MSEESTMKILHVYRSIPTDDVKKLVEILSRDREATHFNLYDGDPNYAALVDMMDESDQTVTWW